MDRDEGDPTAKSERAAWSTENFVNELRRYLAGDAGNSGPMGLQANVSSVSNLGAPETSGVERPTLGHEDTRQGSTAGRGPLVRMHVILASVPSTLISSTISTGLPFCIARKVGGAYTSRPSSCSEAEWLAVFTSDAVNFQWETAVRLARALRQGPLLAVCDLDLGDVLSEEMDFTPEDLQRWEWLGAILRKARRKVRHELRRVHVNDMLVSMFATLDIDGLAGPPPDLLADEWEGYFSRPSLQGRGRSACTAAEVASRLGLVLGPSDQRRFIEDDLDGLALLNLTDTDLQSYGITDSGTRQHIIRFANWSRMIPARDGGAVEARGADHPMDESLTGMMAQQAARDREVLGEASGEIIPPSMGEMAASLGERSGNIVLRMHAVAGLPRGRVACAARMLNTTPGLPFMIIYRKGDGMCCFAPACKRDQWIQLLSSDKVGFWASEAEEIARVELEARPIVVEADQLLGNINRPPCTKIVSPVTELPIHLASDCRWRALQEIVRQAEEMARRAAERTFAPHAAASGGPWASLEEISILATLDMNDDNEWVPPAGHQTVLRVSAEGDEEPKNQLRRWALPAEPPSWNQGTSMAGPHATHAIHLDFIYEQGGPEWEGDTTDDFLMCRAETDADVNNDTHQGVSATAVGYRVMNCQEAWQLFGSETDRRIVTDEQVDEYHIAYAWRAELAAEGRSNLVDTSEELTAQETLMEPGNNSAGTQTREPDEIMPERPNGTIHVAVAVPGVGEVPAESDAGDRAHPGLNPRGLPDGGVPVAAAPVEWAEDATEESDGHASPGSGDDTDTKQSHCATEPYQAECCGPMCSSGEQPQTYQAHKADGCKCKMCSECRERVGRGSCCERCPVPVSREFDVYRCRVGGGTRWALLEQVRFRLPQLPDT